MLILSRKVDERIMIGDEIEISVVEIRNDQVKIGIAAPLQIKVYRKEVYQAIQQENIEAAKSRPSSLPEWKRVVGKLEEEEAGEGDPAPS
jgi:carbon storage regulator